MSREDRRTPGERTREGALERLTPRQWLARRAVWPVVLALFLLAMALKEGETGSLVPVLMIVLFWGGALLSGYLKRAQQAGEVAPRGSPQPTELSRLVGEVTGGLRRHGRVRVAETIERGLAEVQSLAPLAGLVHGQDEDDLESERARMRAKAAAAQDVDARLLWSQNAEAVERRIAKLQALHAAHDRSAARIEAFRQAVKSLALDVARLDLTEKPAAGLSEVDTHAAGVEQEVEALVRAHEEIVRLDRVREVR